MDYKKNLGIVKELIRIHAWNLYKIIDLTGKIMCFECLAQKSHSKFCVIKQKDKDLWKDPSYAGTRPYQTAVT